MVTTLQFSTIRYTSRSSSHSSRSLHRSHELGCSVDRWSSAITSPCWSSPIFRWPGYFYCTTQLGNCLRCDSHRRHRLQHILCHEPPTRHLRQLSVSHPIFRLRDCHSDQNVARVRSLDVYPSFDVHRHPLTTHIWLKDAAEAANTTHGYNYILASSDRSCP